jgi:hypothetical protein
MAVESHCVRHRGASPSVATRVGSTPRGWARVIEYLEDHPQSTTGDMARGSNANRGTIAAAASHLVRACEAIKFAPTVSRAPTLVLIAKPPTWLSARASGHPSLRR